MQAHATFRAHGEVVVLRYITTDGRIEMCWPCRIVADADDVVALFIAAGSVYKAGPKKSAAEKRRAERRPTPPDEYVWRNDTLRLMFPGACHSVSLFWAGDGPNRELLRYFVNMEEPFRRTACGFDTQDHTVDVVVTPELEWRWRDEDELENHVKEGFFTPELAAAARAEGRRAIDAIEAGTHPCLHGWREWRPARDWAVPEIPSAWNSVPPTHWERRAWAYGPATTSEANAHTFT
jgi:hypothetical protein